VGIVWYAQKGKPTLGRLIGAVLVGIIVAQGVIWGIARREVEENKGFEQKQFVQTQAAIEQGKLPIAGKIEFGPLNSEPRLSDTQIKLLKEIYQSNEREVLACYVEELLKLEDPEEVLWGKLELEIILAQGGKFEDIRLLGTTMLAPLLEEKCVLRKIKNWNFEKVANQEKVAIKQSVMFTPVYATK
jgi:hypothetical protein